MNDAFLTTLRYTLDDPNLEYQQRQFFNRTSFDYMSNDGTMVYLINRPCKMDDYENTWVHQDKIKFGNVLIHSSDQKNRVYLVFQFKDAVAHFELTKTYQYHHTPHGKTNRYFMEFGDYYFIPVRDMIKISE